MLRKVLVKVREPFLPLLWRLVRDNLYIRIKGAPDFPNSASSSKLAIDLTIRGINESLEELIGVLFVKPSISRADEIKLCEKGKDISAQFVSLFSKNGSDKSTTHSYHHVYASLICNSKTPIRSILEIGIGTNNVNLPSNMGRKGRPGASLRSWQELLPNATIIGADIDEDILIFENNINSFLLDQTSNESWGELKLKLKGNHFDLIIDDGLHSPLANLKTIRHSLDLLSPKGVLVVEDIAERSLPYWLLFCNVGIEGYKCQIVQAGKCYLLLVSKM